jgi:2-C-methyl-D-erythritol 4-phosphate cytidylyltransferase / 2-C-methyl-D-erythritol 2,4-cyclodiphosphate synthase
MRVMIDSENTNVIIVAAGNGSRAGSEIPKQFRVVHGKPLLRHSYEAFLAHGSIGSIVIVIGHDHVGLVNTALAGLPGPILVTGGNTRQQSVANGIAEIAKLGTTGKILIHDAARPFLPQHIITDLIAALTTEQAAVPALPVIDSLARGTSHMSEAVDRHELWRVQTPQAFHFDVIAAAHRDWSGDSPASDDASMVMASGIRVALIAGDDTLAKFTFPDDFSDKTRQGETMQSVRIGQGFDVHRLVAGEELWLCGLKIDHSHGLMGHSDADVALHAITDAMLGALALGDIGDHFPPTDARWRGAASDQFARHALGLAMQQGYRLSNVDVTIICEAPKIGPHRSAMRERLAEILATDIENISVKATTTEQLGFTGRGEGIAAQAVISFVKQDMINALHAA